MDARTSGRAVGAAAALSATAGTALAHAGGLASATPETLAVPTWLFLGTGGAVIGASFLLASFATDREFLSWLHGRRRRLPAPRVVLRRAGQALGLLALAVVLVAGVLGPAEPLRNAAILLVWVGWWAGYAMTTYLVGNTWPALDPFRTLAAPLGDGRFDYPDRLGAWPSVAGLLALVYLELVSPIAADPRLLAAAVAAYGAVSLGGAFAVGRDAWFDRVDPISRVFRRYGQVAPVRRTDEGLKLSLPGAALVDALDDRSEAGFVVALVWATTFDGLTSTPLWAAVEGVLVGAGLPVAVLRLAVLAGGFFAFYYAFRLAARAARRSGPTHLSTDALMRSFAPSLLAIAAGYHLAHYLAYFLALLPALVNAVLSPLSPGAPATLAMPPWVATLPVAFVLLGHLLAVWAAHGVAFERFPGRMQAVRSQYAVTAVMVGYTMTSLWIVSQPGVSQ